MTQDNSVSIQGVVIRATALDVTGKPLVGTNYCYVMSAFIRAQFTPEYITGDEFSQKSADGTVCLTYRTPDILQRATLQLLICEPDPEFTSLVAGGTLFTSPTATTTLSSATTAGATTLPLTSSVPAGQYTVGPVGTQETVTINSVTGTTAPYTANLASPATIAHASGVAVAAVILSTGWAPAPANVIPNPNGFALEVWSRRIKAGRQASVNPYYRFVFPAAQLQPSGDRVIENGVLANTFTGYSDGNANFGTGPTHDWAYPSSSPYQYAVDSLAPLGTRGFVTTM